MRDKLRDWKAVPQHPVGPSLWCRQAWHQGCCTPVRRLQQCPGLPTLTWTHTEHEELLLIKTKLIRVTTLQLGSLALLKEGIVTGGMDSWHSGRGTVGSLVLLWRVEGQGSGRGVSGVDPAGHPVVGQPVGTTWEVLLKDLPVVVSLFGLRGEVRKCCLCLLKLGVVNLV